MSVHTHRSAASSDPARVAVVTVSSTRSASDDTSGDLIASKLVDAGHDISERRLVDDDLDEIRDAATELEAGGAQVVIFTGGTGISARDITPEALEPLFTKPLPGFGELFRWLSFEEIGAAAMLSRATAGMIQGTMFFAIPGSTKACTLAMDRLILPELGHLVGQASKETFVGAPNHAPATEEIPKTDVVAEAVAPDGLPDPSGTLGQLEGNRMSVGMADSGSSEAPSAGDADAVPDRGWKRAVYELSGKVRFDLREDLPQPIEKLAPVVNLLETAGEFAVLTLENGLKYSLFGWPDLRRDSSKVIAIGWGEPLAEVLALHRYPTMTGTCIEEGRGLLPDRWKSVEDVTEKVCGRAPKNTDGELFAMDGKHVWIQRGQRVFKWDGSNEREDGNYKQTLVSLMIDWHTR